MEKDGSFSKASSREELKTNSKTDTTDDLRNCISKKLRTRREVNELP
jgi:hypothetical protein